MDHIKDIFIPKWAGYLYVTLAVILAPWTIILSQYLPSKHLSKNWDALWVGFDIILLFTTFITLYFIIRRKIWVIVSGSALATLLIVDAWFDNLTARPGHEQRESLILGIIEVCLALLTYKMVYHVIHQTSDKRYINFQTKRRD